MLVTVTQQDIDKGRKGSPTECPIALALQRSTGNVWAVSTIDAVPTSTPIMARIANATVALPASARSFVGAFDCGLNAEPFSFHLEMPFYDYAV